MIQIYSLIGDFEVLTKAFKLKRWSNNKLGSFLENDIWFYIDLILIKIFLIAKLSFQWLTSHVSLKSLFLCVVFVSMIWKSLDKRFTSPIVTVKCLESDLRKDLYCVFIFLRSMGNNIDFPSDSLLFVYLNIAIESRELA